MPRRSPSDPGETDRSGRRRTTVRTSWTTVTVLRLLCRLPKGQGIVWRIVIPLFGRWLRRVVWAPSGFLMSLDLNQLLDFEYLLGHHDKDELEFLLDHHEEDAWFLDIGANQGFYSLFIASRRSNAKVLAFEPDRYSLVKLQRNIEMNGFEGIIVCPFALTDRDETRSLHIARNRNRGQTSLLGPDDEAVDDEARVEVPCRKLISVLTERGVTKVWGLKIDVEGYEYPTLRGFLEEASRDLYPRSVIVEAHGSSIALTGGSPITLLLEHGYELVNHTRFNFFFRLKPSSD